jgi:hypothetical protein
MIPKFVWMVDPPPPQRLWPNHVSFGSALQERRGLARDDDDEPSVKNAPFIIHTPIAMATATLFLFQIAMLATS